MHRVLTILLFGIFGALATATLNGILWFVLDIFAPHYDFIKHFGPELAFYIGAIFGLGLGGIIAAIIAATHVSRSVGTAIGAGTGLVLAALFVFMESPLSSDFLPLGSALSGGIVGWLIALVEERYRA